MLKNNMIVALRNIKKNNVYSLIKIIGLSMGIACGIIIYLFIQQEMSFDRFHQKADRIFRLDMTMNLPNGEQMILSRMWSSIAPRLPDEFPDVESAVRLVGPTDRIVSRKEKRLRANAAYVDPGFFNVFTFPLIQGDPNTALRQPYSIVISEDFADKLFPGENPIGEVVQIEEDADFMVTGVMDNIPVNSHLQTDLFVSYVSLDSLGKSPYMSMIFLLLKDKAAAARVEKLCATFGERGLISKKAAERESFHVRPLTSVYLHSEAADETGKRSQIKYSYYLAFLGLFIIALSVMNVMNLMTANAFKRMKEVGVRKVIGAGRWQVMRQFLVESLMISSFGTAGAVVLAVLFLPFFNTVSERVLSLNLLDNPALCMGLIGFLFFCALASGMYPAVLLSSLRTADTLQARFRANLGSSIVRRFLVFFQFSVCILFLIGMGAASRQIRYVMQTDLGFDKQGIVITPIHGMGQHTDAFKSDLLKNPGVVSATTAGFPPGYDLLAAFTVLPEGHDPDDPVKIPRLEADSEYFKTLGIPIIEGRDFLPGKADYRRSVIINEKAAEAFGWTSAIGKRVTMAIDNPEDVQDLVVVGVVKDYNIESLHKEIAPAVFLYTDQTRGLATIRIRTDRLSSTVAYIQKIWEQFNPSGIFEPQFLDERLTLQYEEEIRINKILIFATVLSVCIACLGLLGLAAYACESRTKEIGIRKVLGASIWSLLAILGREFFLCVLAANIIAWPAAYIFIKNWLQNFAYRIPLGIDLFVLSAVVALFIALFTVVVQTAKTALANPIKSLKYE